MILVIKSLIVKKLYNIMVILHKFDEFVEGAWHSFKEEGPINLKNVCQKEIISFSYFKTEN